MLSNYIAHLDGYTIIQGGWLNHHWIQLGYQLADSATGFGYSFLGSCLILFLINLIPGCHLRATEEAEVMGMDDAEIGEFAVSQTLLTFILSLPSLTSFASMTTSSSLAMLPTANRSAILTLNTLPIAILRLMRTRRVFPCKTSTSQGVKIPMRVEL